MFASRVARFFAKKVFKTDACRRREIVGIEKIEKQRVPFVTSTEYRDIRDQYESSELSSSKLHVEDKHFLFRMFLPDVGVNRGRLFAAQTAVRALKSWLVTALVVHVTIFVSLQGETATALLTLKRFLLVACAHLQALPFHVFVQVPFADHARSALERGIMADRKRKNMES